MRTVTQTINEDGSITYDITETTEISTTVNTDALLEQKSFLEGQLAELNDKIALLGKPDKVIDNSIKE